VLEKKEKSQKLKNNTLLQETNNKLIESMYWPSEIGTSSSSDY